MEVEDFIERLRVGIESKTGSAVSNDVLFKQLFQSDEPTVRQQLRLISYRPDKDAIFNSLLAQFLSSNIQSGVGDFDPQPRLGLGGRNRPSDRSLSFGIDRMGLGYSLPTFSTGSPSPWSTNTDWMQTLASTSPSPISSMPSVPERGQEEIVDETIQTQSTGMFGGLPPDAPAEMYETQFDSLSQTRVPTYAYLGSYQDGTQVWKRRDGSGGPILYKKTGNEWYRREDNEDEYQISYSSDGRAYENQFGPNGQFIGRVRKPELDEVVTTEEEQTQYQFIPSGGRIFRVDTAGNIEEVVGATPDVITPQQGFQNDLAAAQFNQNKLIEQRRAQEMAANLALQVSDRERAYMSDLNDLIRDPSSTLAQINWFRGDEEGGRWGDNPTAAARSRALSNAALGTNQYLQSLFNMPTPVQPDLPTNSGLLAQIRQLQGFQPAGTGGTTGGTTGGATTATLSPTTSSRAPTGDMGLEFIDAYESSTAPMVSRTPGFRFAKPAEFGMEKNTGIRRDVGRRTPSLFINAYESSTAPGTGFGSLTGPDNIRARWDRIAQQQMEEKRRRDLEEARLTFNRRAW